MKIFSLFYFFISLERKLKGRLSRAGQRKEISPSLFLRLASLLIVFLNVTSGQARPPVQSALAPVVSQAGLVLSKETVAAKTPTPRRRAESPDLEKFLAKAAFVIDATSSAVLYQINAEEKLPPASLTKMMTALVTAENTDGQKPMVISSDCLLVEGAKVGFKAGQTWTTSDLLTALILPSAADAACVLSQSVFFTENSVESSPSAIFLSRMNQRAAELGLRQTHFSNVSGLDGQNGEHLSSARDLFKLAEAFWQRMELRQLSGLIHKKIRNVEGVIFDLKNTNELLILDPRFKGIKTGYTPKALGCLAFVYERDGHLVLGVILGSRDRFADAQNLVKWIFESYDWE